METIDANGLTPLCKASLGGLEDMVEFLLSSKAHVESKSAKVSYTPLMCACRKGNEKIFDVLVKKKASVHTKGKGGVSPLLLACLNGNTNIVRKILAVQGVDLNTKYEKSGDTPMIIASNRGNAEIVEMLIDTGKVDIDACNAMGWTPVLAASDGEKKKGRGDLFNLICFL